MTSLHFPTPDDILDAHIDITGVRGVVSLDVRADGKVIWVNVDGICLLRICQLHPSQVKIDAPVAILHTERAVSETPLL
jgi:hypothetical protein